MDHHLYCNFQIELGVPRVQGAGASFVAATARDPARLGSGVDRAIDYTREDWWDVPEFAAQPFDQAPQRAARQT